LTRIIEFDLLVYSSLLVAAQIKRLFGNIELEPKLPNGKSVDVKFQINSGDIFAEVIAPKESYKYIKKMNESAETGKVVTLEIPTERASEKIITELEHFSKILEEVNLLLIINLNDTEIEDIDIEDSILGLSKLVVKTDRETKEVTTDVARDNWKAFMRDNDLRKIGAVICYKRDFAINGNKIYEKRIFVMNFDEAKFKPLTNLFN
jgi:hypothetical protein